MSAICGILPFRGGIPDARRCQGMAEAMKKIGPDRQQATASDEIALGCALYRRLPEDSYDHQPLWSRGRRFLLVADVRLDNRSEILSALGGPASPHQHFSDSDLLLAAFEQWDQAVFDRLVGEFAVAIWDTNRRRLILARDPTGQRPLFYRMAPDFFAFASLPSGLHALPEISRSPDSERLSEFLAQIPSQRDRSFFTTILQVEAGHVYTVTAGSIEARRYWSPSTQPVRRRSPNDYVDAFRDALETAVRSQLRGTDGCVAAHLSSGFDSSAVAATAAKLTAAGAGRVLAFTAAPRADYDGPVPRGRLADESGIAADVAAMHANMDHQILRPAAGGLLDILDDAAAMAEEPLPVVCNNLWWREINARAARLGARVMLTGEAGNMTISAGGLVQLADMVREGRLLGWAGEARALIAHGSVSWRGVLANSFGAWMPEPLWNALSTRFVGTSVGAEDRSLVAPYWRDEFARRSGAAARDSRPPGNSMRVRLASLQDASPGLARKRALGAWGMEERDPTADRRLAEFCLTLPPEMLLHRGITRPLARSALADRLPGSVLHNRMRGIQSADWHERITQADAYQALERVSGCDAVGEVVDLGRVRRLIEHWPSRNWSRPSIVADYRLSLVRALAVAHFIRHAVQPLRQLSCERGVTSN